MYTVTGCPYCLTLLCIVKQTFLLIRTSSIFAGGTVLYISPIFRTMSLCAIDGYLSFILGICVVI